MVIWINMLNHQVWKQMVSALFQNEFEESEIV